MSKQRNVVGRQVRTARQASRPVITQEELVARLAVRGVRISRAGVSKLENGERAVTDREVVALADALSVSITALLGIETTLVRGPQA